jgi:hypothetical protein
MIFPIKIALFLEFWNYANFQKINIQSKESSILKRESWMREKSSIFHHFEKKPDNDWCLYERKTSTVIIFYLFLLSTIKQIPYFSHSTQSFQF